MLRSNLDEPIPPETARVACAALNEDNRYMKLRKEFGTVFDDRVFAALFPTRGQPAAAPWRLALVTILQFAEACRTEGPLMRFVRASIGSICWAWN